MDKLQAIIGDYQTFLTQMLKEITEAGFDMADFTQMDHMCYRTLSLGGVQGEEARADYGSQTVV